MSTWTTLVMVALAISPAGAQAPKRDVSTLEKAVLGHWRTDDDKTDYYFAADGSAVMLANGRFAWLWAVESKDERASRLVLSFKDPNVGGDVAHHTFTFTTPARDRFDEVHSKHVWRWMDAKQHP